MKKKSTKHCKRRGRRDDWDLFFDRHKPLKNHINPDTGYVNGEGPGCLFETFGRELEFVRQQPVEKVFTLIDCIDNGKQYAIPGYHHVNRIGYFVVEIPWTQEQEQRSYKL